MNTRMIAIIGGVAFVVLVVLAVLFTIFGWWPVVVDIVLVIAALTTAIMVLALILAVINLTRTIREIRDEMMPVLESLKSTSSAVRETAKAATSFGVAPAVRTASFVVGVTEIASVVLGRGKTRKRAQDRQKRRAQLEREMAARGDSHGH